MGCNNSLRETKVHTTGNCSIQQDGEEKTVTLGWKKDADSSMRFLRTMDGIADCIRELRFCVKELQGMSDSRVFHVVDKMLQVMTLLNTAKERFRADVTIPSKTMYIHKRTKRFHGSLLDEAVQQQELQDSS